MKKQCGKKKKTGKSDRRSNFEERIFFETMEQYEARIADRCEVGKGCCALRILEAEDDFRNEVPEVSRWNCRTSYWTRC